MRDNIEEFEEEYEEEYYESDDNVGMMDNKSWIDLLPTSPLNTHIKNNTKIIFF
jgi:hypothetical protein